MGEATTAPGIIFSEADNVIPDVMWASYERLAVLLATDDISSPLLPGFTCSVATFFR